MGKTIVINGLVDFLYFIEKKEKYDTVILGSEAEIKAEDKVEIDGDLFVNSGASITLEKIKCKRLIVWGMLWTNEVVANEVEIKSGHLYVYNKLKTNLFKFENGVFFIGRLETKKIKIKDKISAERIQSF